MRKYREDQEITALDMRSDLCSMLMPFFPEEQGLREYNASLNGYSLKITADDPDIAIATPADRKILNLLAGAIAKKHPRRGGADTPYRDRYQNRRRDAG